MAPQRFSLKSLYYLGSCIILTINTVACVHYQFFINDSVDYTSLMVVISAVMVTAVMCSLARQWPSLVQVATDMEGGIAELVQFPNSTHVKCTFLSYVVVATGLVEHVLYFNYELKAQIFCSQQNELNFAIFDRFLKKRYATTFAYLPFYRWLAICAEFLRVQNTFMWNLTDIIGICFSIYFTSYIQEIGKIICSNKTKNWGVIRACYSRLAILLSLINKQLGPIILVTAFFNLFFICVQLFKILQSDIDTAYQLYYGFSFMLLIIRSMTFVYMATNVHTSAIKAFLPVYEVPSWEYSEEVEYLQMQFRYNTMALNGVFFHVERRMILRAIATIVTYELVLLQFSFPRKFININDFHNRTQFGIMY